uniref:TGF-beta propeptide domain-containing protein n=1 Tax=Megaselia scalaris TaxID=36166 RepID=T1H0M7_MEGSC
MRAWLLILAVLATLQITTQVASTEDQQIQEIHQKQNSNPDLENSSSPSPPPPSTSSYSLPVIVNTSTKSKIDKRFPHHHKFRLSFNLSSIPENEKLKAAELQINRDAIDLSKSSSHSDSNSIVDLDRTRYQVFVYDILKVGIKGQREPSFRLIDTKHILLNSTDVLSFDVQPAVERWLATPKTNHGLLIEVRTSGELKP